MRPPVAQPIATYPARPMMPGHGYPHPVYPMFPPSLPMPPLMSPMFPLMPQPTYQPLMPREEPALYYLLSLTERDYCGQEKSVCRLCVRLYDLY